MVDQNSNTLRGLPADLWRVLSFWLRRGPVFFFYFSGWVVFLSEKKSPLRGDFYQVISNTNGYLGVFWGAGGAPKKNRVVLLIIHSFLMIFRSETALSLVSTDNFISSWVVITTQLGSNSKNVYPTRHQNSHLGSNYYPFGLKKNT